MLFWKLVKYAICNETITGILVQSYNDVISPLVARGAAEIESAIKEAKDIRCRLILFGGYTYKGAVSSKFGYTAPYRHIYHDKFFFSKRHVRGSRTNGIK